MGLGLADAFGRDDRTEIKTEDLIALARKVEFCRLLLNAIDAGIPYPDIRKIFGQGEELKEYRETGLTPKQIHEIDQLYAEKCAEVVRLEKEIREVTRGR